MNIKIAYKRFFAMFLCLAIVATVALTTAACDASSSTPVTGPTEVGTGSKYFFFNVVDTDGNKDEFKVYTDESGLGEALMEAGLLQARQTEFGLWLEKVNGIGCDYEVDHIIVNFFIEGFRTAWAVGETVIESGATYELQLEAY